jgi:nucleoside-diphosphate-sugar epimerase
MGERICVTGASGKAGRAVVRDLLDNGYEVAATDLVLPREDLGTSVLRADLTEYGEAIEALAGAEAVVHLANIPAPGLRTPSATFNENMAMNFNVFMAAASLDMARVVWASSETTLGLPFDEPPRYAPVDEDHYPLPTTTYALSKVASETVAKEIAGWSGIPFIGLRFSNILGPADYEHFPEYWPDAELRKWNLWGYIDERDAAAACRLALAAPAEDITTHDSPSASFIIAAADTVMDRPSAQLLEEVFPGVPLTGDLAEFGSLLATDRAHKALGFVPKHSWRDHVKPAKPKPARPRKTTPKA